MSTTLIIKGIKFRVGKIICWFITCLCVVNLAHAKSISVAAGWARPPYINPVNHTGFELDIIRHVLSLMGHKTKVVYVPYLTTIELLKAGQVDIALTLSEGGGIDSEFLSDVYISYQNVVLSLKRRNIKIDNLQSLSLFSLIGFQSAQDVLGASYLKAIKANNLYFEMADQRKQVELFLQSNVDTIVLDINVFDFLSKDLTGESQFKNVKVHPLFPINSFRAGFKDKSMKKHFNEQLREYLLTQQYEDLRAQYHIKQITPLLMD